jgi:hypothetical protein
MSGKIAQVNAPGCDLSNRNNFEIGQEFDVVPCGSRRDSSNEAPV